MQFTAEEAFEARDCGEPIMISAAAANAICQEHGETLASFVLDAGKAFGDSEYDAADVLRWLGY